MEWKLKTMLASCAVMLLQSCGFKPKPGSWTFDNSDSSGNKKEVKVSRANIDNNLEDILLNCMADDIRTSRWQNIASGKTDAVEDGKIIKEYLEKHNTPITKGDSVLQSVDFVIESEANDKGVGVKGYKLKNPVYAKALMVKSNVEEHGKYTIYRKAKPTEKPSEIDNVYIASTEHDQILDHINKVRKMVDDATDEKGLHKGDTVATSVGAVTETRPNGSYDIRYNEVKKVVEKDGISPTVEDYDKTEVRDVIKVNLGYVYKIKKQEIK